MTKNLSEPLKWKELPIKMERKIIENSIKKNSRLVPGESWFLLHFKWYTSWKLYAQQEISDEEQELRYPKPIRIKNLPLFDIYNKLRKNISEQTDYILIHNHTWDLFQKIYGGGPKIARKVIKFGKQNETIVEINLLEFEIYKSYKKRTILETKIKISRKCLIKDLFLLIGKHIKQTKSRIRIFKYKNGKLGKEFTDLSLEIGEAKLTDQSKLVYQICSKNYKKKKEKELKKRHKNAGSGENSTSEEGWLTNFSIFGSKPAPPKHLGLTGLRNLGNTCFMNSGLQCLLNLSIFREYFLNSKWEKEINRKNPIGMKGNLALAFAKLIQEYWGGKTDLINPSKLKSVIGKFATQFMGFSQQDSQELISFLLDGLHEDLNRIIDKPYVEEVDGTNCKDIGKLAQQSWQNYKKRNDSFIVDHFQGLLLNKLNCPMCGMDSFKLDPLMYLTVPLPSSLDFKFTIMVIPPDRNTQNIKKYHVISKIANGLKGIIEELSSLCNYPQENLYLAELYQNRVYQIILNNNPLPRITNNDTIVAYVIESLEIEKKCQNKFSNIKENDNNMETDNENDNGKEDHSNRENDIKNENKDKVNGNDKESHNEQTKKEDKDNENDKNKKDENNKHENEKHFNDNQNREKNDQNENDQNKENHNNGENDIQNENKDKTNEKDKQNQKGQTKEEDNDNDDNESTNNNDHENKNDSNEKNQTNNGFGDKDKNENEDDKEDENKKENESKIKKPEKQKQFLIPIHYYKLKKMNSVKFGVPELIKLPEIELDYKEIRKICKKYILKIIPNLKELILKIVDENPKYIKSENENENGDGDDNDNENEGGNGNENENHSNKNKKDKDEKKDKEQKFKAKMEDIIIQFGFQPEKIFPIFRIVLCEKYKYNRLSIKLLNEESKIKIDNNGMKIGIRLNPLLFEIIPDFEKQFSIIEDHDSFIKYQQKKLLSKTTKITTLKDCLNSFQVEEKLSPNNKWYCPNCKKFVRALKKLEIWELPEILIIQLKRFSQGPFIRRKISRIVDLPMVLDMYDMISKRNKNKLEPKKYIYELCSISNHYGGVFGGHYTAYAKNDTTSNWYHYDDSTVTKMDKNQPIVTSAAYVLFYKRKRDL
ncbi:ubiquitin carboxyl-terminal hydrolase [Anaeramoeba flamelloides]|uniref:Ubiquitin carboxyl-terminal hydrolase n=1 Tax=Anaeramoeba flamelloides TaxID=1746091 RepID=A0AAV7ZK00_9EUKA|nr:ubiquitin carboxyl-terminal hydrolase [Anaeramoeba flamelloides]